MEYFMTKSNEYNLFLSHRTNVLTKPGADPKRVLLEFKKEPANLITDSLVVELSRHVYSEDYIRLTKDFYLNM